MPIVHAPDDIIFEFVDPRSNESDRVKETKKSEKTCPSASLTVTWNDIVRTLASAMRPATNRLSHGTVHNSAAARSNAGLVKAT
jgi:hypothetical protein